MLILAASVQKIKMDSVMFNTITLLVESSSESEDEQEIIILEILKNNDEIYPYDILLKNERIPRNSIKHYFYKMVPDYTDVEFRTHFRISRALYENLSKRFLDSDIYKSLRPDKRLPERLHMLVFLWFAGHEACSFSDLSDRFNLSRSTICVIINRVTLFISSLSKETIKWPNEAQQIESSKYFESKCLFPKTIGNYSIQMLINNKVIILVLNLGCIDGTHIVIDPPSKSKDEYIDKKGSTSICMQGICDEKKKFLNVFIGYPGSCHDSWVLKNSPIYEKLPTYCGGNINARGLTLYVHIVTVVNTYLYKTNHNKSKNRFRIFV